MLLPVAGQIQSTYALLGGGLTFPYTYDPSTNGSPASGFMQFDNASPNSAATIILNGVAGHGEDVTNFCANALGDMRKYGVLMYVKVESLADPTRWSLWFISKYSGSTLTVTKVRYAPGIPPPLTLLNDTIVSFVPGGYPGAPVWLFDTSTTASAPGNGFFRMNTANAVNASKLYVNSNTQNFGDWTGLWINLNLTAGPVKARLLLQNLAQEFGGPGNIGFAMYELNALVQQSGYMEFDVTYVDTTNPGGAPLGLLNDPIQFNFQWVGGGTKYLFTAVKTSAYGAHAYEFVPVDTTSGAVTVTLPAAPSDGALVGVKCVVRGGSNNVTVATAGSDVFNVAAGPTTLTLSAANSGVGLQYVASSAIWYVTDTITT